MNFNIIYGSPGSGKTTYIKDNKKHDDIVIDIDLLCMALSMNDMHDKSEFGTLLAIRIRKYILSMLWEYTENKIDIWYPVASIVLLDLVHLAIQFDASICIINPGKKICKERLFHSERPDRNDLYRVIDRWYDYIDEVCNTLKEYDIKYIEYQAGSKDENNK